MALGIGYRIKQKRLELGLTQMELASRMGYTSKAAICKVEKGDDNITTDRVRKFAKALGVTEAYLMGWDKNPNSEMVSALEKGLEQHPKDGTLKYLYDGIKHKNVVDNITDEECDLIRTWRTLSEEEKRFVMQYFALIKKQTK